MRFKNKTQTTTTGIKVGSFLVLRSPSPCESPLLLEERTHTDDTSKWKNGDLILITREDNLIGKMFGTNNVVGAQSCHVRPATIEEINNFYKRVYNGEIYTNIVETFKESKQK